MHQPFAVRYRHPVMPHAAGADRMMFRVADAAHPGQCFVAGTYVRPGRDFGAAHRGPRGLTRHVTRLSEAVEHVFGIDRVIEIVEHNLGMGIGISGTQAQPAPAFRAHLAEEILVSVADPDPSRLKISEEGQEFVLHVGSARPQPALEECAHLEKAGGAQTAARQLPFQPYARAVPERQVRRDAARI